MNHGFHFVQHQQLFQNMLYRSLNYMFSTTVLTCYSFTLCTTHIAKSSAKTGCWVQNLRFVQEFWEDMGTNTRTK